MDALINVVLPVFGIILTGYLAGRFEALGRESAAALNRFVFHFALPCALFIFTIRQREQIAPNVQVWARSGQPWVTHIGSMRKIEKQPPIDQTGKVSLS